MVEACKSNANFLLAIVEGLSGERERNTWAIYLLVGDNSAKVELIPNVVGWRHLRPTKVGDRKA